MAPYLFHGACQLRRLLRISQTGQGRSSPVPRGPENGTECDVCETQQIGVTREVSSPEVTDSDDHLLPWSHLVDVTCIAWHAQRLC